MDFRFRVGDNGASSYFSSPSTDNYFTEQALRAGFFSSNGSNIRTEMFINPVLQREIEKERIREEILAEELVRKRALEAEVRREILMERELVLRRPEGFSLLASSSSMMRSEPRILTMHHPDGARLEERLSFPPTHAEIGKHQLDASKFQEKSSVLPRSEDGVLEKLPIQRQPETKTTNVKPLPEVKKGQVLFFAKPVNSNLAGMKRKAAAEPADASAVVLPMVGLKKKKPQKEWSCALCQVSATCEQGLNDHLQGKKHKAKESELKASNTTGKNTGACTSSTKNVNKPINILNPTGNPKAKKGKKQPIRQDGQSSVQKKQKTKASKKFGEAPSQKKQKTGTLKRKFKIWCEICQVGTHSSTVMAAHQKGKKHLGQLQKLKEEANGPVPGTTTIPDGKPKNEEMSLEEANEETAEIVNEEVDEGEETNEAGEAVDSQADGLV